MPNIIKNGKVVADNWLPVEAVDGALPEPLPGGDLLLPLAVWREHRPRLLEVANISGGRLGVTLEGHDEPAAIAGDLKYFALIAVNFPQSGDGRGYSLALLLRERYGYRGELRATGDVIRDNLFYLAQCGFDAFQLAGSTNLEAALASLADFSESYQATAAQPLPLFRRRLAGAAA